MIELRRIYTAQNEYGVLKDLLNIMGDVECET
jgi:hypothetical protein